MGEQLHLRSPTIGKSIEKEIPSSSTGKTTRADTEGFGADRFCLSEEVTRIITMALRLVPLALVVLHIAAALPAITLQDLEVADDTMSVGSYVREVRAAAPQDYHKSYENEGDGEVGYSRKKSGGGKKGYQHFDTFHKKAGDHYEFEKQDSYGLEKEGQDAAHSHRHEQRAKPKRKPEDAEKLDDDEGHVEIDHEELKEGAPDGNGGIEAFGHNPKDYILPEKYTYGEDEEEN
ncbi:hypothetical protein evm_010964 [Chilo suppressalis]|nr:hypothetical protein evm_010964 [Chilo suppressalis]